MMKYAAFLHALTRCVAGMAGALSLASPAVGQDQAASVRMLDYGVYEDTRVSRVDDPEAAAKEWFYVDPASIRLVKQTDSVVARIGVTIGVRFYDSAAGAGEEREVTVVMSHPPMVNPEGDSFEEHRSVSTMGGEDSPGYSAYTFDYAWECVVGPWTFALISGDAKPVATTITVRAEDCAPLGMS